MANQLKQVLHMKEGTCETSYAKTSYIQKQALTLTRCIRDEAIREFCYCNKDLPITLTIADLGCSSAVQNTLEVISELISTVEKTHGQLIGHKKTQEYQIYLNDLPTNDFNTVFKAVASFEEKLKEEIGGGQFGHFFVSGVPGSFYGRLFPSNSLHFVHSSYSLMWLSQVPEGIEENKGNIYIARTSPLRVIQAYFEQFQKDFSMFIRCRSKEVVEGGRMVLTILGRKNNEPHNSKESCYMWELLSTVLNDMASQGVIKEEKIHTFNIPSYTPSPEELGMLVEREGSFALNKVHVSQVQWGGNNNPNNGSFSKAFDEYDFAKCMRSVAEPLLVSHFGESIIIDQVFERYLELVRVSMAKEKNAFINVTVSMTRKGLKC